MSRLSRSIVIILILLMAGCQRTPLTTPTIQLLTLTPTRTITPTPPWLARVLKRATRTARALTQSPIETAYSEGLEASEQATETVYATPSVQMLNETTPTIMPSLVYEGTSTLQPTILQSTETVTLIPTNTSSTPALPQPGQDLTGLWQQDRTGWIFQFNPDGSFRLADSYSDLAIDPEDRGRYTLQNDQLTLISDGESVSCRNRTGRYNIEKPTLGQRAFNSIQDACLERDKSLRKGVFYWLPLKLGEQPASSNVTETAVAVIPLFGPVASSQANLSGMAWYEDFLILLPADPAFTGSGQTYLYAVRRQDILDFLSGINTIGLNPFPILFDDGGLKSQLTDFQGYRSIAFLNNRVFFLVQTDSATGPRSHLISGSISSDLTAIYLNINRIVEVPLQTGSAGSRYQSLLAWENQLLVLPELNGVGFNTTPSVQRYDANLDKLGVYSFPNLDYALTGASEADGSGVFWIVNRFSPGEPGAISGIDPLAQQYGLGLTHKALGYIERLVAMQVSSFGIARLEMPPVQLELWVKSPRNWQAAARLNTQGLLVVTGKSPETIMAYIPLVK